jgi:PAS domain S-box-containing protein
MKYPVPLRFSIPGMLFLLGLLLAAGSLYDDVRSTERLVEQETRHRAASLGNRMSSRLEYHHGQGDTRATELEFSLIGMEPYLSRGLACDQSNRVLHASEYALRGRPLSEFVPPAHALLIARARESAAAEFELSHDRRTLLAVFPFRLGLLPGELRPSRVAVLSLEYDLAEPKRMNLAIAIRRAGLMGAVAMFLCVLVWWYFDQTVTRRVARLVTGTREVAAGNLAARVPQRGGDELAHLAGAFNQMAGQLQADARVLEEANAALRASERHLRTIIDAAPECVAVLSAAGELLDINPAGLAMCEADSPAHIKGCHLREYVGPEHVPAFDRLHQQAMTGQDGRLEHELVGLQGHRRWLETHAVPFPDVPGKPHAVLCISRDITERKQAEAERARLVAAIEQAAEAIVITDSGGAIQYANPAFERVTGYARSEALGQNPRLLKSGKHDAAFYQQMWATLTRGEVWAGRLINKKKDGELFEEEATISPVRDARGQIVNYVAVKRDVTREVALEAQLRQAQKLEAVGQLAGGVAHDFNNILAVIMMRAELASGTAGLPNAVQEAFRGIIAAADRAANLTRQLLLFSRRQVMQARRLDLNEVVTNLAKMLGRIIGEDVRLQLNLDPAPTFTHADAGMLDQVLMNLAVNARDAMPKGGRLNIETSSVVLDLDQASQIPEAVPGRFVCLRVSDTGCGIPPEVLPHVFEPFFTTKETGKGTGLGLATVFGIVKLHRGWLQVDSKVGHGTTFSIFLPAGETPAGPSVPETAKAEPRGGAECIMLVEDDPAVRQLTRLALERKGYRVVEAANGVDAQRVWVEHGPRIDLLLTDLVMPEGLDGRELAAQLRQKQPGLKVVFISGYSPEIAGRQWTLAAGQAFIKKPCGTDQLASVIRQCLDG